MVDAAGITEYDDSAGMESDTPPTSATPDQGAAFGVYPAVVRGQRQRSLDQPVDISDDAGFEALKPGQSFKAPDGSVRKKPYTVRAGHLGDQDFNAIPEGATFLDPEGNERQKPAYEPISFSAQTLHSMSVSDKEKRKALEKFYPGMVEEDANGELTVNDNGTLRKPGRWGSVGGTAGIVSGNAAPMALAGLGSMMGAAGGTAIEPGGGSFAGGVGGAMLGGMAGQYFNDILLHLSGTYDRTQGEDLTDKVIGAASAGVGEAGGRAIAGFVPSIKAGVSNVGNALPKLANKFLGTTPENVTRFRQLAEMGEKPDSGSAFLNAVGMTGSDTTPGISTVAKESPHLQNVQERFNEGFDTSRALKTRAENAYETMARPLLEKQGVSDLDNIVKPPSAVSTKEAGETVMRSALEKSGQLDRQFAEELANRAEAAAAGYPENAAQREVLLRTAREQHENASRLVNGALQEIDRTADQAVQAAANGTNSGDLWQAVAGQLRSARQALGQRFRANADNAYATAPAGARIRTQPIVDEATSLIEQMPAEFEARNPALVRRIRNMGERPNPEFDPAVGGSATLPPEPMTLAEMHQLRTDLRGAADWYDLPSDFKNGVLKQFSHNVDQLIQGAGREGSPFETAVRLLNENDAWFARERPIFNAKEIDTVIKGLKAGEPADPETLFKALVKPGNGEMIERLQQVIGPNLWNGVRAAQKQRWLQNARSGQFDRSIDASKFAKEIIGADNDGTLFSVQGRAEGERMLTLAQQIAALDGKLPIEFRPNDTVFDVFRQAHTAMQQAGAAAERDPLGVLQGDIKSITKQLAEQRNAAKSADPLSFLEDKSFGATHAVNKILGDEDLVLAAAHKFGEHSPEFNALRQVWTERIFKGTMNPSARLEKVSPEIQKLMLGVNEETAKKIAEDMTFIMGAKGLQRDTAAGMMVQSKIEHPVGGKTLSRAARIIPGTNTAARATWGAYFKFMSKVMESPSTARWLEKAYAGPAEKREMVRQELARVLQRGGSMGAGVGEGVYEGER